MNLHEIVSQLIVDTKGAGSGWLPSWDSSLGAFGPELILCATMVLVLALRVPRATQGLSAFYPALVGSVLALFATGFWRLLSRPDDFARMEIFTGMLVFDGFTVFIRTILLGFAVLFVVFTKLSGIPDNEDGPDIYALVMGSTLGMCLMASSNHMMMVFMAVEMASVPSYVLAGMLKGRRTGSEAALKYSVYGAGAAGVMLYGISLLMGIANSGHLPTIATSLAEKFQHGMVAEEQMVLALAGLMIGVGLAFKLSAVPFHFWCPDVFEGASAEVGAFLSVASKAAALALLVRVALGVGTIASPGVAPGERSRAEQTASAADTTFAPGLFALQDSKAADTPPEPAGAAGMTAGETAGSPSDSVRAGDGLWRVRNFAAKLTAFLAILTCTFGNLAAYGQTNIKRLLAYSTIAHAGYMMMAVPPILALAGTMPEAAEQGAAGLAVYITVYLFMNLGVFAVVAFLRNEMRSEEVADYAGLLRRCPVTAICLATMLFSLVGLPPLAGFVGKWAVFAAIANGYQGTGQLYLLVLLLAGAINTAISLFYYLRIVRLMTMEPEPESRVPFTLGFMPVTFIVLLTAPTALLIVAWGYVDVLAKAAAESLFS